MQRVFLRAETNQRDASLGALEAYPNPSSSLAVILGAGDQDKAVARVEVFGDHVLWGAESGFD